MDNRKNFWAQNAIARAELSSKNAEEALLLAAEFIRSGEPIPPKMAEYLADAIESAIKEPWKHDPNYTPEKGKGRALAVAFKLEANNRRPATIQHRVIREKMKMKMAAGLSQNQAAKVVAEGMGLSVSNVKRIFKGDSAPDVAAPMIEMTVKLAPEGD